MPKEQVRSVVGWEKSEMRTYLKDTIKPLIPQAVRNSIKTVTRYSDIYDTSATKVANASTSDDVWIPSAREIFGGTSYESSGPVYTDLFDSANNRKKFKVGASSAYFWWLRSAYSTDRFRCVSGKGSNDYSYADIAGGVALGFCT